MELHTLIHSFFQFLFIKLVYSPSLKCSGVLQTQLTSTTASGLLFSEICSKKQVGLKKRHDITSIMEILSVFVLLGSILSDAYYQSAMMCISTYTCREETKTGHDGINMFQNTLSMAL